MVSLERNLILEPKIEACLYRALDCLIKDWHHTAYLYKLYQKSESFFSCGSPMADVVMTGTRLTIIIPVFCGAEFLIHG